jgi:hypothetical protein
MNDKTENLVLEHLRALRTDTGELKKDVHDVKARLASIESIYRHYAWRASAHVRADA